MRLLGQGEFGSTWLAEDDAGQPVAIKLLKEPPGGELRTLARIVHPGVVGVLGGGGEPVPHLAMEFVPGKPLMAFLRSGPAPEQRALAVVARLADALDVVHRAGVVHGDLKPDNVMIEAMKTGRLRIIDFGLAEQRKGGTLNYAAPERMRGGSSSPESDVYSLGLILWEMLHGSRPFSELGLSTALLRRQKEVPEPQVGDPWLQELLRDLLATDPSHRPTAGQLADRLIQRGVPVDPPDVKLLTRRARSLWILDDTVRTAVDTWLGDGGRLALVGPSGSGRSHVLDHVANELQARGTPWVRLDATARSWASVEGALASPSLPGPPVSLPDSPEPEARAAAAALLLRKRCPSGFALLADDLQLLDEPSRLVLRALAEVRGVALCTAAPHAPEWADARVRLRPLDHAQLDELSTGLLGDVGGLESLVDRQREATGGMAGQAVAFTLHAVREGALVWRSRAWQVDPLRLASLQLPEDLNEQLGQALGETAQLVGALAAIHEVPAGTELLFHLAQLDEDHGQRALRELIDARLVRVERGVVRCRSEAAARSLAALHPDPVAVHRSLVEHLLQTRSDPVRLGWHVIGCGDVRLAEREGPRSVAAATALDGAEATRLADALWDMAPVRPLAVPRMRALLTVGRVDEAEELGQSILDGREDGQEDTRDDVDLLGTLARIRASLRGDDETALAYLERARIALEGAPLPEELVEIKAHAHYRADRTYEAIESARPLAERPAPEEPERVDRWLRMRMVWAQCLQKDDRLQEGISLLEAVPAELGRGRPARAELDADLGRMLWYAGRVREAADVITRAADGESGLSTQNRARLLNTAGMARYGVGDRPGALKLWEQASILFEQIDFPVDQVRIRNNLCVGYRESGQWERSRDAGEWALARATDIDDFEGVAMVAGNLGDLALAQDRLDDAEEYFRNSRQVADEHGIEGELVELARRRAELAVLRADLNAADLAERALEAATKADSGVEKAKSAALLALAHARAGELSRMDERLKEAIEPLREAGASGELAEVRLWAAQALLVAGRVVDALQEATRALVYADEVEHTQLRKRADTVVERIRRVQGAAARSTRLDRVLELAVAVAREQDMDQVLRAIAGASLDLLDGERSFVLLDEGGEPSVAASAARKGVEPSVPSMSVVKRALTDGREVIAADLGERADLRAAASVQAMELRSAMCVPMIDGETRVGALYVDSRVASEEELTRAATLLRALGSYAAVAVHNARHLQEARGRARQAAEIAHDLRSPAASIHLAATELLGQAGTADPRRDRLVRVLEASQRIQDLAGEFLREGGTALRPLDLSEHLGRLGGLLGYEASSKGVTLQLSVDAGLRVRGDRNALSRVITNLVTNAVKYSPDGGVVTLSARENAADVLIGVRDRGEGIPADDLARIFDRGAQAEGAREGYGLGLAIARRLVEEHGGTIAAANHPDGGALFSVRLPIDAG